MGQGRGKRHGSPHTHHGGGRGSRPEQALPHDRQRDLYPSHLRPGLPHLHPPEFLLPEAAVLRPQERVAAHPHPEQSVR